MLLPCHGPFGPILRCLLAVLLAYLETFGSVGIISIQNMLNIRGVGSMFLICVVLLGYSVEEFSFELLQLFFWFCCYCGLSYTRLVTELYCHIRICNFLHVREFYSFLYLTLTFSFFVNMALSRLYSVSWRTNCTPIVQSSSSWSGEDIF